MTNTWQPLADEMQKSLGLKHAPIAISFCG